MRPSERPRSPPGKAIRALHVAARAGAVLVAAAACAILTGYAWLHTTGGEAWLLRTLLGRVNRSLHGSVAARRLVVGGVTWALEGVVVRTERGKVVATVDRIDGLPLFPNLAGTFVVDGARLRGATVDAEASGRGVDVARALASRRPSTGSRIRIRDVYVDLRSATVAQSAWPGAPRRVAAGPGRGRLSRSGADAPYVLRLDATLDARFPAPLHVEVTHATGREGAGDHLVVEVGGVRATVARGRAPATGATWTLDVEPEAGRALVPAWPLAVPLAAEGSAHAQGAGLALTLAASAAGARARVEASLASDGVERAEISFQGMDLSRLLASGPASHLAGRAELRGLHLAGPRRVDSAELRLDAGRVGPVRFDGAVLRAEGALGGGAQAALEIAGVDAGTVSAAAVAGTARLGPPGGSATIALRVERAAVGGRQLPEVRLDAALADGAIVAAATAGRSTGGGLAGQLRGRRLRLSALRAHWPGAAWRLEAPGFVELRGGTMRVALQLRSGEQRLAVAGFVGRSGVDARLRATDLELSRLPAPSLPRGRVSLRASARGTLADPAVVARLDVRGLVTAAGLADAALAVRRAPGGHVRLQGRVDRRGAPRLGAALVAEVRPGAHGTRVDAELRQRRGGSAVIAATYARPDRFALAGVATGLDPAPFAPFLPAVRAISGRIDGQLRLTRDGGSPRVDGRVTWRRGALSTRGYGWYRDIDLAASVRDDAFSLERLDVGSKRGRLHARGSGTRRRGVLELHLDAWPQRFPVMWAWRFLGRATGHVGADAALRPRAALAAVTVSGLRLDVPMTLGTDVQQAARPADIHVAGGPGAPPHPHATRRGRASRAWHVALRAPGGIRVHGAQFDLELALTDPFVVDHARRTRLYGTVRVARGALDLLGSQLHVVAGAEVRFAGRPDAPFVDVGAASGLGGGLVIRASTAPEGTRWTLAARDPRRLRRALATQRRPAAPGTAADASNDSAVARWIASQIPLATLLDPALATGTEDVRTAFSGRFRVGAIERPAADPQRGEDRRQTTVDVGIVPELHLEGRFGERAGSLDLFWEPPIGRKAHRNRADEDEHPAR